MHVDGQLRSSHRWPDQPGKHSHLGALPPLLLPLLLPLLPLLPLLLLLLLLLPPPLPPPLPPQLLGGGRGE